MVAKKPVAFPKLRHRYFGVTFHDTLENRLDQTSRRGIIGTCSSRARTSGLCKIRLDRHFFVHQFPIRPGLTLIFRITLTNVAAPIAGTHLRLCLLHSQSLSDVCPVHTRRNMFPRRRNIQLFVDLANRRLDST
ncbi:MAG: hypothetical protein CME25_17790 [Gemmatimonadetes bacterium]|nr:hypothetical protein [Gemmatimonadota bacterium]